jgi:hypothetical protein
MNRPKTVSRSWLINEPEISHASGKDNPDKTGNKSGAGYKRPPKEHQFKPGNKGGGRPKITLNEKNARAAVLEALWQFAQMTKDELQTILKNNPTGAQVLAGHAILGDKHVSEALNRLLGKVRDALDLTSAGAPLGPTAPPIVINCADIPEEKLKLLIAATDPARTKPPAPPAAPATPAPEAGNTQGQPKTPERTEPRA